MKEQQQQSSGVGGEGGIASDTTDADKLNVNRIACPELDEIYATHQVIVKILLGQQKIIVNEKNAIAFFVLTDITDY